MVHRISGSTLIGREKELNEMFDDLRHDKSVRLLIGESGIGKSALLDEFHRALVEDRRDEFFVGYYSRLLLEACHNEETKQATTNRVFSCQYSLWLTYLLRAHK